MKWEKEENIENLLKFSPWLKEKKKQTSSTHLSFKYFGKGTFATANINR